MGDSHCLTGTAGQAHLPELHCESRRKTERPRPPHPAGGTLKCPVDSTHALACPGSVP